MEAMDLTADTLVKCFENRPAPAYPAMASLALLAASLPNLESTASRTYLKALPDLSLRQSMSVLKIALFSSHKDAGLTWIWHLVHSTKIVEYDVAIELFEVNGFQSLLLEYLWALEFLIPLIGSAPSSISSLATFKLLGAIIEAVPSSSDQIDLFMRVSPHYLP